MKEKDAVKYYHGEENFNCAQAILKAYQEEFDIKDEQIDEYKDFGRGRAEGGLCGAIFAVKKLIGNQKLSEHVEQSFSHAAGGVPTCREIRKLKQLSCRGCVKTASQLLHKHLEESK